MRRSPMLPQKRPNPDSQTRLPPLSDIERKLYQLIKSKGNIGIWQGDIRKVTDLPKGPIVDKALKSLQAKNLIKVVTNVHNKVRKIFMAVEFEPAEEISGGSWYSDGNLDTEFMTILKDQCLKHVERLKVATIENIYNAIRDSRVFNTECSVQQITQIFRKMVLDKELQELKSTGKGEFNNVGIGKICYRSLRGKDPQMGTLASIPCGVCPRITECTPDGIVSPLTCVYYNKWLSLDF